MFTHPITRCRVNRIDIGKVIAIAAMLTIITLIYQKNNTNFPRSTLAMELRSTKSPFSLKIVTEISGKRLSKDFLFREPAGTWINFIYALPRMPPGHYLNYIEVRPLFSAGTLSIRHMRDNLSGHIERPISLNAFTAEGEVKRLVIPNDPGNPKSVLEVVVAKNGRNPAILMPVVPAISLATSYSWLSLAVFGFAWFVIWLFVILVAFEGYTHPSSETFLSRHFSLFGSVLSVVAIVVFTLYSMGLLFPPYAMDLLVHWNAYTMHAGQKAASFSLLLHKLSLSYPFNVYGIDSDEQLYNGSVYSNWGIGIPLLQIPFHLVWRIVHGAGRFGLFPDAWIFWFYYAGMAVTLNYSIVALLRERFSEGVGSRGWHWLIGSVFTVSILVFTLVWLIVLRFAVYEETICYFIIAQLYGLAFYINYIRKPSFFWAGWLGLAVGVGLLIRPTGLFYVPVWALCIYWPQKNHRNLLAYASTFFPSGIIWGLTNLIRSGGIFNPGFRNFGEVDAGYNYIGPQRFPDYCHAGVSDHLKFLWLFLRCLFGPETKGLIETNKAFAAKCTSLVEYNNYNFFHHPVPPFIHYPILMVLVFFGLLVWRLFKPKRLDLLAPFLMVFLLSAIYIFVMEFSYRYIGDFTPLAALIIVQWFLFDTSGLRRLHVTALAFFICLLSVNYWVNDLSIIRGNALWRSRNNDPVLDAAHTTSGGRFLLHWQKGKPSDWPSVRTCGAPLPIIPNDSAGWNRDCSVRDVTNFYISVPPMGNGRYVLHLKTDEKIADEFNVFVNGKFYRSKWTGNTYDVVFYASRSHWESGNITVTIHWYNVNNPQNVKLIGHIYLREVTIDKEL